MPSVMVTGANRGLGLEFSRQYLEDGWQVHACYRSDPGGLAGLNSNALSMHPLDISDADAISKLADELEGEAIDLLLNNAGTMGKADATFRGLDYDAFGQTDPVEWHYVYATNVIAPMQMAEAFVEHVARSEQKKLITLTSMVSSMTLNTMGGLYAYRASKAAVNAIMKSMAIDLAPRGIIAAALHPGWARTDMGGPGADIDAFTSVTGARQVIANLSSADAGLVWMYDGSQLPA